MKLIFRDTNSLFTIDMEELFSRLMDKFLRIIVVLFFVILAIPTLSQIVPEDYAESLYQKSIDYLNVDNYDSANFIAIYSVNYSLNNSLPFYEAKSYYVRGRILAAQQQLDSALFYYYKSDSILDCGLNSLVKAKVNARIAQIYKTQNKIDLAIEYFSNSLELFEIANDPLWIGVVNDNLGFIYFHSGNYYKAIEYFQSAISYFKESDSKLNIGSVYNAMGLVYRKTNDIENERVAYLNAIRILEQFDDSEHLANAYNNLSEVYFDDGEIELGLEMLDKAKVIYQNNNNRVGLCAYYAVLSYFCSTQSPVNYNKVLEYGLKGLEIAKETDSFKQYADACYFVGLAYVETNQMVKAKTILKDGCEIADEYDYRYEYVRLTGLLSEVYYNLDSNKKAYETLEQYVIYKDSISGIDKIKEFTSINLSYQFKQEQLKDSITQVQKDSELQHIHDKEIQTQKTFQLILSFFVIVVLIIAVFGFIISRKRKIQSEILNQKNELINKSLYEKELLLKEIHHRVKNNFQTVSSLLEFQARNISDEQAIQNIEEGQSRIKAMSLIHQKLYQNEDLSVISFQDYIEQLTHQIASSYSLNNLQINVEAADMYLDIDTGIPVGLILNELVTNSCKYAFKGGLGDKLCVKLTRQSKEYYLMEVSDSGEGIPENNDMEKLDSLGLRLAKRLAKQLQGSLNYQYKDGSNFELRFKDTIGRKEVE